MYQQLRQSPSRGIANVRQRRMQWLIEYSLQSIMYQYLYEFQMMIMIRRFFKAGILHALIGIQTARETNMNHAQAVAVDSFCDQR
jgi:hypothetical protein